MPVPEGVVEARVHSGELGYIWYGLLVAVLLLLLVRNCARA